MRSLATSDFWASYRSLPTDIKNRARFAYRLWLRNPRHPSLRFKKTGEVWSVRIGRSHRALALLENDTYYWFWIGAHDEYIRILSR